VLRAGVLTVVATISLSNNSARVALPKVPMLMSVWRRWGMEGAWKLISWRKLRRGLLAAGAIVVLTGGAAQAQNIDQGKSATRLFADSCATCHHNPRGLAKGRFRLTLYMFLQQHYAANSSSAWALTSYLESVDTPPPRGRSKTGTAKPHGPSRSSLRPPAPVLQR
jgi:mono/diheme cytochrome c family protein